MTNLVRKNCLMRILGESSPCLKINFEHIFSLFKNWICDVWTTAGIITAKLVWKLGFDLISEFPIFSIDGWQSFIGMMHHLWHIFKISFFSHLWNAHKCVVLYALSGRTTEWLWFNIEISNLIFPIIISHYLWIAVLAFSLFFLSLKLWLVAEIRVAWTRTKTETPKDRSHRGKIAISAVHYMAW